MGIFVLVLLAGITIIIFSLGYRSRKEHKLRQRHLQEQLAAVASKHQLRWSDTEIAKQRALAWSADQQILFYMNFTEDRNQLQVLDMRTATGCRIQERAYADKSHTSAADRHIHTVELEISFKDKPLVTLPMYIELEDGVFERINRTNTARRWAALIDPKNNIS